jgi:hypothetical protein
MIVDLLSKHFNFHKLSTETLTHIMHFFLQRSIFTGNIDFPPFYSQHKKILKIHILILLKILFFYKRDVVDL